MSSSPASAAPRRRLRILTWHVHGNYLYNLTQVPHDFWLVVDSARSVHHTGRSGTLPWGDNVHEAPLDRLAEMEFDVVLYQARDNWEVDRRRWLSPAQRALPRIVLEHDPPQQHPTDTPHWCTDPAALLVHVTPFNALMWDNGPLAVRVVEHGVRPLAEPPWRGDVPEGLVVVNHIARRGRRLGLDIWQAASAQVPLCLVGMGSEQAGGRGEIAQHRLPALMAAHRFFFHPVRHTSLGLAAVEAMLAGLPVVGLATTELVTVIDSGRNGYIDTSLERLVDVMQRLVRDRGLAAEWGEAGRRTARERFSIDRFVRDWLAVFDEVTAA
ncbi:glycosyltransferase family 4 protein [Hydrogenophaga pseudoflava]|uniref:glycosyltransferase family 4 protein n=1 Tax=Hydrogenophaga pseudoflava TaxID=47421 RepID=UPI0027E48028|nr:glycosyltransferase family 4 protein [Hydrogenophaga pseudoflava]MDQ7744402.1 glycosyltransferase family 4 protein [Hydrogenophaga pseudoflava]